MEDRIGRCRLQEWRRGEAHAPNISLSRGEVVHVSLRRDYIHLIDSIVKLVARTRGMKIIHLRQYLLFPEKPRRIYLINRTYLTESPRAIYGTSDAVSQIHTPFLNHFQLLAAQPTPRHDIHKYRLAIF